MSDMRKIRQLQALVSSYRGAAETAFGWAETVSRPALESFPHAESEEAAQAMRVEYMGGLPLMLDWHQKPGHPMHLIGLAFANPAQSAEAWSEWGYRLTRAHDELIAMLNAEMAKQPEASTL